MIPICIIPTGSGIFPVSNKITMGEETNSAMAPGRFGWNELLTSDIEAAKKFYRDLFGWESETKKIAPGWNYTLFKKGESMVGGAIEITSEMGPIQPHWLSYVMSTDIGADLEKAKAAGGTVLKEPMDVPDTGTLAIIQDPQGAVFALWKCMVNPGCE